VIRRLSTVVFLLASLSLVARAEAAALKVSSFPSGAQVSIDGVSTGKVTPMNVSLPEGDHSVTVAIPGSGWNPDTRIVTIVSGNNDLSVTLLPTPTPGPPGPQGATGATGQNGADVRVYLEAAGANCPTGGVVVVSNTGTHYVCNGAQGPTGTATHAAPPCFDNGNRYVDCGNGTVTDTVTGLIWLQQADCLAAADWASGNQAAAALKSGDCSSTANPLSDGSSPGDWRLPTRDEWSATIARAAGGCRDLGPAGPPPSLTNDAGTGCLAAGPSSFAGVSSGVYWSSTPYEPYLDHAWSADLVHGYISSFYLKGSTWHVWPVRGGTR
jgi:hypothetical protein